MKTREEILKENYGYDKASFKYILPGAEILKYIGQTMVLVHYKKENETWDTSFEKAEIISIDEFNPMIGVYKCKYKTEKDEDVKEIEMIPEGYSFADPEKTNEFVRFVPYSTHCKMIEDEALYNRLKKLFETRDTITIEGLQTLSLSKEKDKTLRYFCNIGAVVKMNSGDILYTRIHNLSIQHKHGTTYALSFGNESENWRMLIDSKDKFYDFEKGIGQVKLLDLRGE